MSKMKHLLRKLHIGGGGGGGDHHSRLSDPSPSAATSPSPTAVPPSDGAPAVPAESAESAAALAVAASDGFSYFEEEYQVQLALALSASDPDGLEDPDSVQMQAATRMSLGCSAPPEGCGEGIGGDMEYLSRQYWNYNVVDYNEKLLDGFYDVYGIILNSNLLHEMPSLEVLQATPVADDINYEVVIVNRAMDQALQQLERRAMSIAMESRAAEAGILASGLIQKIADLVVDNMGGPVGNADDILRRWTLMIHELRTSLNSIVLPLGSLKVGLSRHRALLFKVLADSVNLPCRLVKGSYCTGTDEGAVNLIKIDYDSEYIIDLMGAPGSLIPSEKPGSQFQSSGSDRLTSNTIGQTVKDLWFGLDKVCQFDKKSEVSEESSSATNSVARIIALQSEENSRTSSLREDDAEKSKVASSSEGDDVNITGKNLTERSKHEFVEGLPRKGRTQAAMFRTKELTSPSQLMKVNDVSKSEEKPRIGSQRGDDKKSKVGSSSEGDDVNITGRNQTERFKHEFVEVLPRKDKRQAAMFNTKEVGSPSQQMKVNDVSKYVVNAAKDPDFAQKLHAILLESGASPPPDLFSNLNPSQDSIEPEDIRNKVQMEGSEEVKEGQSLQDDLPLSSQPFYVPSIEAHSSIWADACNKAQMFSEEMSHKLNANATTSGGLVPLVTLANEISLANLMSKHSDVISGTAVKSGDPDRKQIIDSSQKHIVTVPKAFDSLSSQKSAEIVTDRDTKQYLLLKDCPESMKESMVKCIGMGDSNLHILSDAKIDRINPVLADVAEWEIPWEDLHFGERIGIGSYGEVYHADWNGTAVAVKKFLDQDLSGDALEQFRSEVKIMLRLRHPNVVLFMGAVTRPPNLSILTEFLPRGSLYKLLHRTNAQLDEKRRLKMALDVARGMNYLHTSHPTIVHRDLKSPNLLVDKNWVVKVCDFGLSRLKHHTFLSSKSTAGTPEWMAPEVLRNEPSNEKCDVYSFGVILWELATLRIPWSGLNSMQVVGAVGFQNKHLEIPKDIDPMAAKIISDCWESDPNQRPSFTQLMRPLKQLRRLVAVTN